MQKGLTTLNKICSYTYNILISLPGCDKRSSPIFCTRRPGCHRRHVPVLPALVPDALRQMHWGFVQGELWPVQAARGLGLGPPAGPSADGSAPRAQGTVRISTGSLPAPGTLNRRRGGVQGRCMGGTW